MAVPYVKFVIEFSEKTTAETVKTWMQNVIGQKELAAKVGDGQVIIADPATDDTVSNMTLIAAMRLTKTVDRSDIISQLKTKAKESGVVDDIISVKILQHTCTHDERVPQPCTDELIYEYP